MSPTILARIATSLPTPIALDDDMYIPSDATVLTIFFGFMAFLTIGSVLLARHGQRVLRKQQIKVRTSVDADLEAAFPDAEERKKWLLERKLEMSYAGLVGPERTKFLEEGVEKCGAEGGFKDVKGA